MPETYNEAFTKWKYEDLPILPQYTDSGWQYQIADATKKQFGILKKLMHRDDVISLICATDAAREGELIYRLVYKQAGCKEKAQAEKEKSPKKTATRKKAKAKMEESL